MDKERLVQIVESMRRDLEWAKAKVNPPPNAGEVSYVEEFSEANPQTLKDIETYVLRLEDALELPHEFGPGGQH
jgi:hypothetical protein